MTDTVDGPPPRDGLRAADADRERVAERLRSAHAEGRLSLAEYDERVQQAWAARTYAELDRLTADLPQVWSQPVAASRMPAPQPPKAQEPVPRKSRREKFRRGAFAAWLSVSLINVVIWALVSLSTLNWIYPWWIWVAGPWGAVLLAQWISDRGTAQRGGADPPR